MDEREIYLAVDKLNAMGYLPGFLANTRPYDMEAVRAAVDNNPVVQGSPGPGAQFARWVALYANDKAVVRGTASLNWSSKGTDRENNDGATTPEGFAGGVSALGRWEPHPYLSGHVKGIAWFGSGGEDDALLGDTALEFGHKYISLQAGMLTTWYGPGRRGTLIFTNNAEPYPGIRIHNPVPIPMPWIFSFLGNLQYDMFVAKMDQDRPVPNSRLAGMRIAVRPSVWLEVGLSRAIHYGGDGRDNGFGAFWSAVFESNYGEEEGVQQNNLAGFDVELTLPFKTQPVQIYYEQVGEDQQRGEVVPIPIPEKWAYLGGVFLPSILGNPSFDLRVEYAINHIKRYGTWWYTHPSYPHEYKGRFLGHPMGTDAEDFFVEGHWFFLPSTYLQLSWSSTTHFFGSGTIYHTPGTAKEKIDRVSASFAGWFTRTVRLQAFLDAIQVKNEGGSPGKDSGDYSIGVALSWQYSSM